jgi:hypothetical protein
VKPLPSFSPERLKEIADASRLAPPPAFPWVRLIIAIVPPIAPALLCRGVLVWLRTTPYPGGGALAAPLLIAFFGLMALFLAIASPIAAVIFGRNYPRWLLPVAFATNVFTTLSIVLEGALQG